MPLNISTNLASLGAQRSQARTQNDVSTSIARLSSGLRVNSAKDDAAGLAIADRFTSQIRGVSQAGRNANDGISLVQTAEGSLASIGDNLQRIRELAVQSSNASNSASDRASLQLEVSQLQAEIDRVAAQTSFNGVNLLDGSFTSQAFQVGANGGESITVPSIPSVRGKSLGVYQGFGPAARGFAANNTAGAFSVTVGAGVPIPLGMVFCDARALAAALNTSGVAGLSAVAAVNSIAAVASAASASTSGSATFSINNVAISLAGTNGAAGLAGNRSAAVAAINAQSAATGVVASDTGSGVSLLAADGRNVALSYSAGSFTGSSAADFGLSSAALSGSNGIYMYYVQPPGVTGVITTTHAIGGGLNSSTGVAATGTAVSALDISTVAGANTAIASIDVALATVDAARASLGAVQNRFTSAIDTLRSSGENLSASRGRIQDADFAAETANLSRAQVLQQAGTAMIAQANQSTSQMLTLLR